MVILAIDCHVVSSNMLNELYLFKKIKKQIMNFNIDLMHKSSYGPCILGNRNLCIVIGYSSRRVTNNNA